MAKKVITTGAHGQDGSYMCELLREKQYEVYEVTRENSDDVFSMIETIQPNEIYNFAGISNVISPYDNLDELFEGNAKLPMKILETIVRVNKKIKFFQASSSLIFGRDFKTTQNEETPFAPQYAYGVAKLFAQNMVNEFRKTYDLFACCAIYYPHESERRKEHFFSRKITKAVSTKTKVVVGDLEAYRDYGYAKDYVEAAYYMMQAYEPKDYVVGTGNLIQLREFAEKAFASEGLNYLDYVLQDKSLVRKNDTGVLRADSRLIKHDIGWYPKTSLEEMIRIMINADKNNV